MPVAVSDSAGVRPYAQFGQHRVVKLTEPSCAFSIGTDAEKLLLESKVGGEGPRELKRNRRIQIEVRRLMVNACKFENFHVQCQAFFARLPSRYGAIVTEEVNFGLQKIA